MAQTYLTREQIDGIVRELPRTTGTNYYEVLKRTFAVTVAERDALRDVLAKAEVVVTCWDGGDLVASPDNSQTKWAVHELREAIERARAQAGG